MPIKPTTKVTVYNSKVKCIGIGSLINFQCHRELFELTYFENKRTPNLLGGQTKIEMTLELFDKDDNTIDEKCSFVFHRKEKEYTGVAYITDRTCNENGIIIYKYRVIRLWIKPIPVPYKLKYKITSLDRKKMALNDKRSKKRKGVVD